MTPAKDSDAHGHRRQEAGTDGLRGKGPSAGRGSGADSRETERELRAGGAAAGIGAGAAVGGVEGAAVASGLEAGKSLGDEAKTASKGTKGRVDGSGKAGGAEKPSSAAGSSQTGGAGSKPGRAAAGAKGAARSAMNVAAADSKRAAAAKGAGEAMKRSGSSTVKAAGTVLSADGSMTDKAQQGAALAAGIAAAGAVSSTGVGTVGAKVAAEATTRVVGSQTARRHGWKVLLLVLLLIGGPSLTAAALMAIAVPVVISSMSTEDDADDVESMCTPNGGGTAPSTVVGGDVEEKVWNYLRGAGYSEEQTAGVMGNIQRESQFNPWAAQNKSTTPAESSGWGLVQWTADRHGAVRDAVIDELGDHFYVGAPDLNVLPDGMTDDDVDTMVLFQMRYIIGELESTEQAAGDHLASTSTVEEATRSFEEKYERAGVAAIDDRIANANALYALYSGSPVPEAGGTDPGAEPGIDSSVFDSSASSDTSGCSTSAIPAGSGTGSVEPCPDGGEGCVNIAALTASSAGLSCPDGTSDEGTATAYYEGSGVPIRLCSLDGVTDLGGRPVLMNAMIAPSFLEFYRDAQSVGVELTFTSSYRSHVTQQSIYASSPGNAARPGWSNHEFGMAFDVGGFSASYNRNNCGTTQTLEKACAYPGTGAELEKWKKLRSVGLKHGMYIHDQEFWHIEFIPSGKNRDRGIPIYEG